MSANPNEDKKDTLDNIYEKEVKQLELEYLRSVVEEHKERRKPSFFRRLGFGALGALGGGLFGIALAVIATSLNPNNAPAYVTALPEMFAIGGGTVGFALGDKA
ncbi:hypothetical protein STIV2_A103 [Sulfolobus turreted icosahedral virus 2]|uniref:Uncharacterized protein n=1 Tax=Sulfolobus turreted icosahedral virus 2 TaxID=754004 RepID=D5IEX8_9VIRU|nr:hypothetical protein STIV2_A103 [Sulfolobus turreted icosahedral virus 2]ADF27752.1 hypothetical protein STIV2_A103 [Sulfolobus turreted icosahedral virus 2]